MQEMGVSIFQVLFRGWEVFTLAEGFEGPWSKYYPKSLRGEKGGGCWCKRKEEEGYYCGCCEGHGELYGGETSWGGTWKVVWGYGKCHGVGEAEVKV